MALNTINQTKPNQIDIFTGFKEIKTNHNFEYFFLIQKLETQVSLYRSPDINKSS